MATGGLRRRLPCHDHDAGGRPHPCPHPAAHPRQVADLLDTMAMADQALADELDRIGADRRRVCEATVVRLEQLLARVREGADARAVLEGLDSTLLQDGALHWAARRHDRPSRPEAAAAAVLPLSGGRRLSVVGGADAVAVTA